MRAVYIPHTFNPDTDLEKLNKDLKNSYSIVQSIGVNNLELLGGIDGSGTILVISDD